jgi:hypothetical protein
MTDVVIFKSSGKTWPSKGDKVVFIDENGYDHDRLQANKFFKKGRILTVKEFNLGKWSSSILLEEVPGEWFNSVMFDW